MNRWIAPSLFILFVIVFAVVFLTPDERDRKPVTGVNVTVLSGEVEYLRDEGSVPTPLREGDSLYIDPDLSAQVQAGLEETVTPVPGTEPEAVTGTGSVTVYARDTVGGFVSSATVLVETSNGTKHVVLDKNGFGELGELPLGEAEFMLAASGFFPARSVTAVIASGTNEIHITAARQEHLFLALQDHESQMVAGADVSVSPATGNQIRLDADLADRNSDDAGRVQFTPVVSGDYIVQVTAPPYLPHVEAITASKGEETQTILLSESSTVFVKVEDEDTAPVFAAKVTLKSTGGGQGVVLVQETSRTGGDAVFRDIKPGRYMIHAEHNWYADEGKGTQEFSVERDRHDVTLVLQNRSYTISGRVYDKVSGEPVEGIKVVAFSDKKINTSGLNRTIFSASLNEYTVEPDQRATTDSDGTYRLEGLPGGEYTVGISPHPDYVFIRFTKEYDEGVSNPTVFLNIEPEASGVDHALLRSWAVSGHVLLYDRTPLKDAYIQLNSELQTSKGRSGNYNFVAMFGLASLRELRSWDAVFKTGENGEFSFKGNAHIFGEGYKLFIDAHHTKYSSAYSGSKQELFIKPGEETSGVEIVYDPKAIISGHIYDKDNNLIPDVFITLQRSRSTTMFEADDGTYHLAVSIDTTNVTATKEGYKRASLKEPLKLEPGQVVENLDLYMEEGHEGFEGIVVDEDGTPVPRMYMTLQYQAGEQYGWNYTTSGRDGRFTINPLTPAPPGTVYKITAEANEENDTVVYTTTETGVKDIRLVSKKFDSYGSLSGFVQDQDGNPVTRFEIYLVPSSLRSFQNGRRSGLYEWKTVSHPNGAFAIEKIPTVNGPFVVAAKTQSSAIAFSEPVTVQKGMTRSNIIVTINEGTITVTGRVTDQDGKPLEQTRVYFKPNKQAEINPYYEDNFSLSFLDFAYPQARMFGHSDFMLEGINSSGGALWVFNGNGVIGTPKQVIPVPPAEPGSTVALEPIVFKSSGE